LENFLINLGYILAASHSGSTLLAMLLGSHPDILTVGELKITPSSLGNINQYRCSCKKAILECNFWQEVRKGMVLKGIEFDIADSRTDFGSNGSNYTQRLSKAMHRGILLEMIRDVGLWFSPTWHKHYQQTQKRNVALMETVLNISGGKVIIDSSKTAVRLKYLLKNRDINIKIIRLIRDGRSVALTYMNPAEFADAKDPAMRGGGSGGQSKNEQFSMARAAFEWRRSNEEAEHILRHLNKSQQWIEIHYEDLCEDTENILGRLFEFIGVDPDKHHGEFRTVENHIIGNGMRLDKTSEIRLDERWRSVLTKEELVVFNREAGKMNRRYGYI
jgi:hypothetical protein